jgi:hypothetical protein
MLFTSPGCLLGCSIRRLGSFSGSLINRAESPDSDGSARLILGRLARLVRRGFKNKSAATEDDLVHGWVTLLASVRSIHARIAL